MTKSPVITRYPLATKKANSRFKRINYQEVLFGYFPFMTYWKLTKRLISVSPERVSLKYVTLIYQHMGILSS